MKRLRRTFVALAVAWAVVGGASAVTPQTVLPVEQTPYHLPVFRNEDVMVLNVFIPPQRASGFHRHTLDSLEVILGNTTLAVVRPGTDGSTPSHRTPGTVGFVFYSRMPTVHAVTNTGPGPFHNVVVEFLKPVAGGFTPDSRDGAAGYSLVLDNERARVWRLVLEPGERAGPVTQSAPGLRVVVAGGELVERVPSRPDRAMALATGEFYWQDSGSTRTVQNIGVSRIELVEIEFK